MEAGSWRQDPARQRYHPRAHACDDLRSGWIAGLSIHRQIAHISKKLKKLSLHAGRWSPAAWRLAAGRSGAESPSGALGQTEMSAVWLCCCWRLLTAQYADETLSVGISPATAHRPVRSMVKRLLAELQLRARSGVVSGRRRGAAAARG